MMKDLGVGESPKRETHVNAEMNHISHETEDLDIAVEKLGEKLKDFIRQENAIKKEGGEEKETYVVPFTEKLRHHAQTLNSIKHKVNQIIIRLEI